MGVPLPPPEDREQADASVEEESDEDVEAWFGGEEGQEWEDPSGGSLTRVLAAAEQGDAGELAEQLTQLTVSVNTRGGEGDTALHLASLYGHTDCVKVLLEQGARADVADEEGALPIHDAAAGGYLDILCMLLDSAPICIDAPDAEGDTPLNDEFKTAVQVAERGSSLRQVLQQASDAWRQREEREAEDQQVQQQQQQAQSPPR
eukprot:scaffold6.g2826.t1